MTDDMKQARVDSARRAVDSLRATGRPFGMTVRGRVNPNGGRLLADTITPLVSFAPLSEMADYVSPIRQGAVRPDQDNNLWILPTTSGVRGGLLYDVVNRNGELFKRVQVPVDHVIVGFGRGGVIYMAKHDAATKTWVLVRARLTMMPGNR